MAIKIHGSFAIHPGPWVKRNILAPYDLSISDAANHLGISRPPFSNVLNGKAALSSELALRLEKAFGISAKTLLNMQAAHSLEQAAQRIDASMIKRLPEPEKRAA